MVSLKNKKIPESGEVKFAIKEILKKRSFSSQEELSREVRKKLRSVESKYSITGKRIRQLALEIPVRIHVHTRKGKIPGRCPCCGHRIKKIYSKNLYGRKILFRLKCQRCSYTGTEGKWAPKRYEFYFR